MRTTLKQFSTQSGEQLLFSSDIVNGVRTNAVRGEFTPREALERMVAGTGLVAAQDEGTGALVVKRASDPNVVTPSAVSAMTPQFLDDLGITDLRGALDWTLNVEPQNLNVNDAPQGFFVYNFRATGGQGNYPTRNYFLYYGLGDAYNTERFEFARGPNAVLFGDAQIGGVATTFTKVPRLGQTFYRGTGRYET